MVVFSSGPGQSYVFSIFIDSIISDTGLSRSGISALYMLSTGVSAGVSAAAGHVEGTGGFDYLNRPST
ncbi:MAG TPA: hypothetical protein EYO17_06580 [Dehalococcoidia bacterium]|nr:hypothetical protein [Dehalococcoidia bacterium]